MIVKYRCSNGNEYEFETSKMRVLSGSLHAYEWKPIATTTLLGDKVKGFSQEAKRYEITFEVRGSLAERYDLLNKMRDDVENDVLGNTPGTLFYGEWHTKAYMISANTGASDTMAARMQSIVQFYCPDPKWTKENTFSFKITPIASSNNKRYPDRYAHRYANGLANAYLINNYFTDANFILRIYGKVINPKISIGGHAYTVYTILEADEYLEIDSKAHSVIKTTALGEKVNLYHAREKKINVFQKIPTGRQEIGWTGKHALDIVLLEERSEPKW